MNAVKRFALILANSDQPLAWPEGAEVVYLHKEEAETEYRDGMWDYAYVGDAFGKATGVIHEQDFRDFMDSYVTVHPNFAEEYQIRCKEVSGTLAELGQEISNLIARGQELAEEVGMDFIIDTGSAYIDVSRLSAVDWNSSSMSC